MSVFEILAVAFFCLFALALGAICLGRPTTVRDFALATTPRWMPFRGWLETSSYIWSIRFSGVVALMMFLLVVYVLFWGK